MGLFPPSIQAIPWRCQPSHHVDVERRCREVEHHDRSVHCQRGEISLVELGISKESVHPSARVLQSAGARTPKACIPAYIEQSMKLSVCLKQNEMIGRDFSNFSIPVHESGVNGLG
jgi:hypothetical protein